ncbi:MAG: ribosome maturation factor RimM [Bryobacteraceae bacterium]
MPPEPESAATEWVAVAHLVRARGNRGELSAVALTSHVERYEALRQVYLNGKPFQVESIWQHGDRWIFKFAGVDSISDAEKLAGVDVCIPREERIALPPDEYYFSDLIGCRVLDARTGELLGAVERVEEFGGPPLLAVKLDVKPEKEGKEMLIPFVKAICIVIDIAGREIRVDLPEGLKDLNP